MKIKTYDEIGKEPTIIFNEVTDRYEYWYGGVRVYGVREIRTLENNTIEDATLL